MGRPAAAWSSECRRGGRLAAAVCMRGCSRQPAHHDARSPTLSTRLLPAAGDAKPQTGRIAELFVYDNFARTPVDEVAAGDICALTGLGAVSIGETICDPSDVRPLPTIEVRSGCGL